MSVEAFGAKGWTAPKTFGPAARLGVVPLAAAEIGAMSTQCQIFLGQTGTQWQVFAKLDADRLGDMRARPFLVNAYPFTAVSQAGDWVLSVYDDPVCISDTGHAFFHGTVPSRTVVRLQQRMAKFIAGLKQAAQVAQTMATCGILDPAGPGTGKWSVWHVNEQKLATLDPAQLGVLHRSGGLALAYAQVVSQFHARLPARHTGSRAVDAQPKDGFLDAVADDMDDLNLAGIGALIE